MTDVSVLLLNTGTPASCDQAEVRRYLTEFLMDGRVLDLPAFVRHLLVKCIIVPFRYKKSAECYGKIWTDAGSPLLIHSQELTKALSKTLGVKVSLGLSYAQPSIAEALEKLKGCRKLIVVPLFPQYASATSGSVIQEVMRTLSNRHVIPELAVIGPFAQHDLFLKAWVQRAKEIDIESYDHVLFSFHGLPLRHVRKALLEGPDAYSYPTQCYNTAQELAKRLNIKRYTICYQSRLGRDEWLSPYTQNVIVQRREKGDKSLLVFAPSFVADCLETLYEIGIEYRDEFLMLGGERLDLVASLNAHPDWVHALATIIKSRMDSWQAK